MTQRWRAACKQSAQTTVYSREGRIMGFGLFSRSINVLSEGVRVSGDLSVPDRPIGLVVLVSGKTCDTTTIREAASYFERRRFATLMLEHDDCIAVVSDIDWASVHPALGRVPVSCWASSSLDGDSFVPSRDNSPDRT